jgi:polyadenylate-binding protein
MPPMQAGGPVAGYPPAVRPQGPTMSGRGGMPGRGAFIGAGAGRGMPSELNSSSLLQTQLSTVAPQQQKQILGENLFPKIQAIQPELAGKITGMLLEMDNEELINLFENDSALHAKVNEAMAVYDDYVKSQTDDKAPKEAEANKA